MLFWLKIPSSRPQIALPISIFRIFDLPFCNSKFQASSSHFTSPTCHFHFPISHFPFLVPNFKFQNSDFPFALTHFHYAQRLSIIIIILLLQTVWSGSWCLPGPRWPSPWAPLDLDLNCLGRLLASIWDLLGATWGPLDPPGLNSGSPRRFWDPLWCLLDAFVNKLQGLVLLYPLPFVSLFARLFVLALF